MPRMKHPEHGFTTCSDGEVKDLEKRGWSILTDEEWQSLIDAKRKPRIGRPPKVK